LLSDFDPLLEREARAKTANTNKSLKPDIVRQETITQTITAQYVRRMLLHDPVLCLKALDKASFGALLLDDEFSVEDARRLAGLWEKRMGYCLLWMKEAAVEAVAMYPSARQPQRALKDIVDRS
jgi:hypothetical protein